MDLCVFSTNNSQILIKNVSFSSKNDSSIGIYLENETLLEEFSLKYKEIYSFRSYSKEITGFLSLKNEEISNTTAKLEVFSGEFLEIELFSYDFMGKPSNDLKYAELQVTPISTIESRNTAAIFINGKAKFSNLQLVLYNSSSTVFGDISFRLFNKITDKTIEFTKDYSFNLKISLYKCTIGHRNTSNICVLCPNDTYSFIVSPEEFDECIHCPLNAYCVEGRAIIAKEGYWNYDENTEIINKCERFEACLQNSSCNNGYFGVICYDCEEGYGKIPNKKCEKCDDYKIFFMFLGKSGLNLVFLTMFFLVQIRNLKENKKDLFVFMKIFEEHVVMNSILYRFSIEFSQNLEVFFDVQNITSPFDYNLFYVSCVFPGIKGPNFYVLMIMYCYLIPFIFLIFMVFLKIFLKKMVEIDFFLIFLLFDKFFPILLYFNFGLFMGIDLRSSLSVPVLYRNILKDSDSFFKIFLPIYSFILIIFILLLCFLLCILRKKEIFQNYLLFGIKKERKILFFLRYLTFLLLIVFSLRSSYEENSLKQFILYYLIFLVSLLVQIDPYASGETRILKNISLGIIIVSILVLRFEFYDILIIVLNSVFFLIIMIKILRIKGKT